LRFSGELGEDERLAGDRLDARRERVAGEREDEQAGAEPRDAGGRRERPSKLRGRSREIPDAVGDDEVDAASADGERVHRTEDELKAPVRGFFART
jgi:hypothetical protein